MQEPIFVLWTRSFWFTIIGVGALLAQDVPAIYAFAEIMAPMFGLDPAAAAEWFMRIGPAFLFIAAIQQRAGAARPYSFTDPRAF